MSDLVTDPHSVGCDLSQGKRSERLNSSTSVSDLSEGMSDMSLSTSPGSDIPVQQVKGLTIMPTSPTGVQNTSPTEARQPPPRKRLVVRQLSSNPYLTSSEMSPSDDHPLITGSHSYAAGDSRFYANDESFDQKGTTEFDSHHFSHRANSYPLPSHCLDESDEEDDEEEEDDHDEDENSEDEIDTGKGINSDCVDGSKPIPVGHQNPNDSTQQQSNVATETLKFGVSPTAITNSPGILPAMGHNSHNHYDSHQQHDHQQQQSLYYNHHHKQHHRQQQQQPQQQSFRNSHSSAATTNVLPLNNIGSKRNGYTWNANQNELYCAESAPYSFSGTVPDHHHDGNEILRGPPKSTEINSWGHFSKPSDNHYKYRRSHYNSSDSDEETLISSSTKPHPKQSNNRFAGCKGHVPPCRCNQRSSAQNPSTQRTNISTVQQNNAVERKSGSQNGIKPHEFKERFQLMKRWFAECNDGQKNIVLKGMLGLCELPQLHLLSVHMSKELHNGCPSNCEDIITWLPTDLATKVMSYLDPVSLCHAAQVCRVWRQLAEDQSLWRRFCCQTKWRLSKAAEHKQVISHMCPEGSIQWKNVFAERFRLRNNWLKGRCTVRTFEGHLQGISCVQFDDSRIVSGSSDKTIKVWNMRTNAPWSVQTLMGHHGTVRCLHLEGNRLVSGSCDTTIKVWDLSTQESWSSIACKVTMTGHADTVRCLQADDDKVISGSYDKTLKIWDLRSGELRRTLRGHQASVLCVHFSETKIVSGSADKTIKLWNYDGQCMMTLCGHQDAVTCLMFDSTRIVSGSLDHNLKFWDIHTGECLNTIDWKKAEGHTDVVRCLQADSWRVVSAADDKTIKVWNLATGERLVTLRNHTDGVTCLQFNDFIIVSGSYDKSVKLWDFSCC